MAMPVIRATRSILTSSAACLLAACFCAGGFAQESVRLYTQEGWRIPGLAQVMRSRPVNETSLDLDGLTATARTYNANAAPAYNVMLLSRHEDTNFVHWILLAPRSITAYRYKDRLISVLVDGVMRTVPPTGAGSGGTTAEVRLFYEDVDGSGKFHLMIQNLPFDFRPSIPSWAK